MCDSLKCLAPHYLVSTSAHRHVRTFAWHSAVSRHDLAIMGYH
jgi:hypothetical protein